ncbi:MAG: hypothetical protein HY780_16890 [Chloroflexi bacterium]|nr:hypothetical protein [Chloroflexota bacterium]
MTKKFSPCVLAARVKAAWRRIEPETSSGVGKKHAVLKHVYTDAVVRQPMEFIFKDVFTQTSVGNGRSEDVT